MTLKKPDEYENLKWNKSRSPCLGDIT